MDDWEEIENLMVEKNQIAATTHKFSRKGRKKNMVVHYREKKAI